MLIFLTTTESTPGLSPPGVARAWFLFGVMIWNACAIFMPAFPFVDYWSTTLDPDAGSLTTDEQYQRFMFLLYVIWNTMISTNLLKLPTLESTGIAIVTTPPNDFYANIQSSGVFRTYLQTRAQDGYAQANDPSYSYPNKGYYLKVYQNPVGQVPQDPNSIPDPNTWCPLEIHYADGTIARQTPVMPLFSAVNNWFSSEQLDEMNTIAANLYPQRSSTTFQTQKLDFVKTQSSLTDAQKVFAEVWAGTEPARASPPGKIMVVLAVVLMSNSTTLGLAECVALVSGVSFAVFHAAIVAWSLKFKYLQPRPIQVLRQDYASGYLIDPVANAVVPGIRWTPYQQYEKKKTGASVTPAFPDFVSGHSTFTMGAATFIQMLTGTDRIPINNHTMIDPVKVVHPIAHIFDPLTTPCTWVNLMVPPLSSKTAPNVPASSVAMEWTSWSQLAQQVGVSRIYGGIHWPQSNYTGLQVGEWVSLQVMGMIDFSSLGLDFSSLRVSS